MKIEAKNIEEYIDKLPSDKKESVIKLKTIIAENLPKGFHETLSYNMIGFVVPNQKFPAGYHCNPKLPLPFINLAAQKNFIALYHSGIYAIPEIKDWFVEEYGKVCKYKLDMGKSCIRFKKLDDIPYKLIGELCKKITVEEWIGIYDKITKR